MSGALTARLTDAGFAAGWHAVRLLPEPVARGAFDRAGRWAAGRDGRGTRQLRANLRVVTGGRLSEAQLSQLTGLALRSYARYWQEAFRLPALGTERIVSGTELVGLEHVEKARAGGRPLVMALPHSGNWDAAGVWFIDWLDGPFMTVAERLKPESLYERFVAYRESLGFRVVPLTGGPRPSSDVLREWLAEGGVTCLLVDRNLGSGGVPVSFFGREATMPGGAALLAAQTGAAIVPTVCQFTERGWRLVFSPEVPVEGSGRLKDRVGTAMQAVADAFATAIAERPEDWHMLGRIWPDVPPGPTGWLSVAPGRPLMRIGLVCPYQWDVPGGVQYHVRDLAETLRGMGHHVEVLTPAEREESLTDPWITFAGRTVPIPYNGSMASVQFGPVSAARVRRWLRDGRFDVVHVHEPAPPSVGLLVCMIAKGPIVATFHAATTRSKWLAAWGPVVRPWLERISGRIAVSDFARRVQVEHLGGDAVIIPNGVHVDAFASGPTLPGVRRGQGGPTIGFLGRYAEPRKGLPVLLEAMRTVVRRHPGARLLIGGRGDADEVRELIGDDLGPHVALLGELSETDKAAFLRSVDVYCAPNLLGESFGVILIEALAAGAPIVASDLESFARVLEDGEVGVLVPRGNAGALAAAIGDLLSDPARRAAMSARGSEVAATYDWQVLARRILAVYETVVPVGGGAVTAADDEEFPAVPPTGGARVPLRRRSQR